MMVIDIFMFYIQVKSIRCSKSIKVLSGNVTKVKNMIKNLIKNFEKHIDPKVPAVFNLSLKNLQKIF